jgi:hypothetical protein
LSYLSFRISEEIPWVSSCHPISTQRCPFVTDLSQCYSGFAPICGGNRGGEGATGYIGNNAIPLAPLTKERRDQVSNRRVISLIQSEL